MKGDGSISAKSVKINGSRHRNKNSNSNSSVSKSAKKSSSRLKKGVNGNSSSFNGSSGSKNGAPDKIRQESHRVYLQQYGLHDDRNSTKPNSGTDVANTLGHSIVSTSAAIRLTNVATCADVTTLLRMKFGFPPIHDNSTYSTNSSSNGGSVKNAALHVPLVSRIHARLEQVRSSAASSLNANIAAFNSAGSSVNEHSSNHETFRSQSSRRRGRRRNLAANNSQDDALILVGTSYSIPRNYIQFEHEHEHEIGTSTRPASSTTTRDQRLHKSSSSSSSSTVTLQPVSKSVQTISKTMQVNKAYTNNLTNTASSDASLSASTSTNATTQTTASTAPNLTTTNAVGSNRSSSNTIPPTWTTSLMGITSSINITTNNGNTMPSSSQLSSPHAQQSQQQFEFSTEPINIVRTLLPHEIPLQVRDELLSKLHRLQQEAEWEMGLSSFSPSAEMSLSTSTITRSGSSVSKKKKKKSSAGSSSFSWNKQQPPPVVRWFFMPRHAVHDSKLDNVLSCIDLDGYSTDFNSDDDDEYDYDDTNDDDNDDDGNNNEDMSINTKQEDSDHESVQGLEKKEDNRTMPRWKMNATYYNVRNYTYPYHRKESSSSRIQHSYSRSCPMSLSHLQNERHRLTILSRYESSSASASFLPFSSSTSIGKEKDECISGYLLKQSKKDSNVWKRVHCVLADSKLWYVGRVKYLGGGDDFVHADGEPIDRSCFPICSGCNCRFCFSFAQSTKRDTFSDYGHDGEMEYGRTMQTEQQQLQKYYQQQQQYHYHHRKRPGRIGKHGIIKLQGGTILKPVGKKSALSRTPHAFELTAEDGITHVFRALTRSGQLQWIQCISERIMQCNNNHSLELAELIVGDESLARSKRLEDRLVIPAMAVAKEHTNMMIYRDNEYSIEKFRNALIVPDLSKVFIDDSHHITMDPILRFGIEIGEYREICRRVLTIFPPKRKNTIVIGRVKKDGKRKNNLNDANANSYICNNSEEAKMEHYWQTVIVSLWNMAHAVWKKSFFFYNDANDSSTVTSDSKHCNLVQNGFKHQQLLILKKLNQYNQSRKEYLAKSVSSSSTSKRRSSSSAGDASVENDPTKISPPIDLFDDLLGTFLRPSSSFSTIDEGEGSIGVDGAP